MGRELSFPQVNIPRWMWDEVADYDLPLTFEPTTILDIGANIGAFTLLMAESWPKATIIACEPVEENLAGLRSNLAGCKADVRIIAAAVRLVGGAQPIFIGDRGVTCGFHQLGRQTAQTAPVLCVPAATLPRAQFVKIDTEGCEVEIVTGLDLSETQVLACEYHRPEDVAALKHLADLNGLKLHQEKPAGPTWGLLVFAREGAIRTEPVPTPVRRPALKPLLAIPAYGGVDAAFMQCLMRVIEEVPIEVGLHVNAGDSSVCRSRNTLSAIFLDDDWTDLVFIDSDIVFSTADLMRLLSHDVDVVGGFYPKKSPDDLSWVYNSLPDHNSVAREDGLMPVSYMGTGFLRIRRSVFERMIAALPEMAFTTDADHYRTEHAFFVDQVRKDFTGRVRYLTEDWNFCARCADLGISVWGDTQITLQHIGRVVFPIGGKKTFFGGASSQASADRAGHGVIAPTDLARNSQPQPACT